jgi:hypothetical protein
VPDVRIARGALTREHCDLVVPRFRWTGSLGPAGPGNRCTQGHSWHVGDAPADPASTERGLFEELFRQLLQLGVLPLQLDQVESYRAWASSTPAGVEIKPHAHDGDVVVAVYLATPDDGEPLMFDDEPSSVQDYARAVFLEPGLALQWPSSLKHWVPAGSSRAGERTCAVYNVTLRRAT